MLACGDLLARVLVAFRKSTLGANVFSVNQTTQMNLNNLLEEIKIKGMQNRSAIQSHRDHTAGKRGATGHNSRKHGLQGIAFPCPQKASGLSAPPLPFIRVIGKPLACTGPKPDGDGYKRDKITGVITRCDSKN